jgi:hypothetical protein
MPLSGRTVAGVAGLRRAPRGTALKAESGTAME